MYFKITWKTHVACFILCLIISLTINDVATSLFINLLIQNGRFILSNNITFNLITFVILLMIPITIIHEILHGLTYKIFGGKVKFGFKGIYAYCQEISGIKIHRTKFLLVLLAPVTVISIFSLLIPMWLGGIVFILNLLGSSGDLLMSFYLIRTDSSSYILDKAKGFEVIRSFTVPASDFHQ